MSIFDPPSNGWQYNWTAPDFPMLDNPYPGFKGDGKPYAPIYYKLEQLQREYLATVDDNHDNESYTTARQLADSELSCFFDWLLENRKLD